ncbi:MAG TPA: hypothetical protein DDY16_09790, partial [Tenacibaculum sp.]|nr:hypothetical protein [Tenacibaculum sp.]
MKRIIILSILIFAPLITILSQIKIGDNPNVIDGSSILELESSNKVLVVTRVTDAEMNLIFPLEGAIVYNTDQNCIFQYGNMIWKSLCDQTGSRELLFNATTNELTLGDWGTVNLTSLIDDADNDPTNEVNTLMVLNGTTLSITDGGGTLFTDLSSLLADGDETQIIAAGINTISGTGTTTDPYIITATEVDGSVTNEINTRFEVNSGNLEITDGNGTLSVPLTALGSDDQTIDDFSFNTSNNQLSISIEDDGVAPVIVDLSSLASDGSETIINVTGIATISGTGSSTDPYIIGASEVDGIIGNEITDASDGTLIRNGSGTNADPFTLDVATDGITATEIATDAVGSAEIASDAVGTTE